MCPKRAERRKKREFLFIKQIKIPMRRQKFIVFNLTSSQVSHCTHKQMFFFLLILLFLFSFTFYYYMHPIRRSFN